MTEALRHTVTWLRHLRSMGLYYSPNTTNIGAILTDLDILRREVEDCRACPLWQTRTRAVFGEGPGDAALLIVGEAPGKNEDLEGRPFCGRSGELLTRMLNAIEIRRQDAFITSVVKCRPPRNRTPLVGEIKACLPYLKAQIRAIRPRAILALGEVAARVLTGKKAPLKGLREKVHKGWGADIVVTYHPAYVLRFSGSRRERTIKKEVWEDLKRLKEILST